MGKLVPVLREFLQKLLWLFLRTIWGDFKGEANPSFAATLGEIVTAIIMEIVIEIDMHNLAWKKNRNPDKLIPVSNRFSLKMKDLIKWDKRKLSIKTSADVFWRFLAFQE